MSDFPVVCVTRTLTLISIDEQHLTHLAGGGGGGQLFAGHGKVVVHDIQSQTRQKQVVWFRDATGRETSRTLYNIDLQGRPGHTFVEYELQLDGHDDKPWKYINQTTGATFQVYTVIDLGLEWGLLLNLWEAKGGHMLIGAFFGFFLNIPFAWLLMQMSHGLGLISYVFGGPILGAIGLPMLMHSRINSKRIGAYDRLKKAVEAALTNPRSA